MQYDPRPRLQANGHLFVGGKRLAHLGACLCILGFAACSANLQGSDDAADDGPSAGGRGGRPGNGGEGGEVATCSPGGLSSAPVVRRLSHQELAHAIADVFGVDVRPSPTFKKLTPPSVSNGLFLNHADKLDVPSQLARGYADLAGEVAAGIKNFPEFVRSRSSCAELNNNECGRSFVSNLGLRLMRRPLSEAEVARYAAVFETAKAESLSFDDAATLLVEGMLQSPYFLYRIEDEVAPNDDAERMERGFEMASRLSFFIWASVPDEALLDAAREGRLDEAEGMATETKRMLADDRAARALGAFGADYWMRLSDVNEIVLSGETYAGFDAALKAEMIEETRAFFVDLWKESAPWTELVQRQSTRVGERVAKLYGLESRAGVQTYDLSGVPQRRGILSHASVLATTAHGEEPVMVHRGLFILRNLLCSDVPSPNDQILDQIEAKQAALPPDATQRDQAIARMEDNGCGGCHRQFDPLAMVLEPYDSIGRFREKNDKGKSLRTDWKLDVGDGPVDYQNLDDYTAILAESEMVRTCMAQKTLQLALGRTVDPEADACFIQKLSDVFAEGGSFSDAVETIAVSPEFQQRGALKP